MEAPAQEQELHRDGDRPLQAQHHHHHRDQQPGRQKQPGLARLSSLLPSTAPPSSPPEEWTAALPSEPADVPPPVFFFDVDNTLYHYSTGIADLMVKRIHQYCERIGIERDKIEELAHRYYIDYGLAIRGLILHHDVDPVDYDKMVDCSLPLEMILNPDPKLRKMLSGLRMKKWIFTNAGKDHASRVLRTLGIDDLFDGMTYCNYSEEQFPCKPEREMYARAMRDADARGRCYFVDDSAKNVITAAELGWTAVHITEEPDHGDVGSSVGSLRVKSVHDLPKILPELWADGEEETPAQQ